MAGIFPVLLLIASRRKGEHVPATASRSLGTPCSSELSSFFPVRHPAARACHMGSSLAPRGALFVGAAIVVMTIVMARTGSFARCLTIEVREDHGQGRTFFAVTASGHESMSEVLLEYSDGTRRLHTATGEIPAFPSLRRAVFERDMSRSCGIRNSKKDAAYLPSR